MYCLKCEQLVENDSVLKSGGLVFVTGFRRIDGVNYPLAICQNCPEELNALASVGLERFDS